ncbi:hypothetical protein [Psychroserpens luteolus]|uniref:hypothetical protein n=1 Tax=Psychroserpens luteolus TaxID=2855840 RepID=UPI001E54A410|nr:hypothetical protein [Psychroserpens luteolus]MCD2259841.1 hypothetical protein [Psychroserpens luteolus]
MISVKETPFYDKVLKEFNYDFGDIFVFDGFILSEMKEGLTIGWEEHMIRMSEDIAQFTGNDGSDFIYISHRIHSYSIMPSDWLKFFKHSYTLKGYGIVGYTQGSILNAVIENLFFHKKIKRFSNLETAIQWATDKVLAEFED